MCGTGAYENFLEYQAVFLEVADLLNASGIRAAVKDTKEKTGKLVKITLANLTTAVLDEEGEDGWRVGLGGTFIELNIPRENRDAMTITCALLEAIGEIRG